MWVMTRTEVRGYSIPSLRDSGREQHLGAFATCEEVSIGEYDAIGADLSREATLGNSPTFQRGDARANTIPFA